MYGLTVNSPTTPLTAARITRRAPRQTLRDPADGEGIAGRSVRNIALWNSYLPPACVRTMVLMGWDKST